MLRRNLIQGSLLLLVLWGDESSDGNAAGAAQHSLKTRSM